MAATASSAQNVKESASCLLASVVALGGLPDNLSTGIGSILAQDLAEGTAGVFFNCSRALGGLSRPCDDVLDAALPPHNWALHGVALKSLSQLIRRGADPKLLPPRVFQLQLFLQHYFDCDAHNNNDVLIVSQAPRVTAAFEADLDALRGSCG